MWVFDHACRESDDGSFDNRADNDGPFVGGEPDARVHPS